MESSDEEDESSADEFKPGKDEQSSDEDSGSGEEEEESEGSEAEQTPRRKIKPKVREEVKVSDLPIYLFHQCLVNLVGQLMFAAVTETDLLLYKKVNQ